ncbi:winged helix-turn-helix domain-containing protein, partial [Streptomyces sp. 7N604]|uniref:winged helix-turn-helix domain-containing protein n=1 Tax=Streptomyces sp. 7N604 TaxID=3457415 RepID=UPI003FD4A7E5
MPFGEQPAYLRVAGDLRQKIVDGSLPPHTRLPSQARIRQDYGVSDTVALEARKVLMAEGLVEGRSGSGTYVRERPVPRRVCRTGSPSRPGYPPPLPPE